VINSSTRSNFGSRFKIVAPPNSNSFMNSFFSNTLNSPKRKKKQSSNNFGYFLKHLIIII